MFSFWWEGAKWTLARNNLCPVGRKLQLFYFNCTVVADIAFIERAGVRVLSYSNWLIIFLPTNEKPSSFSLSTNDKPPYIQ